ncbi:hypothetical protein [Streptomyces sp. TE5632]
MGRPYASPANETLTLTVSADPIGLGFPLECVDGEVSSTYNELT